jgi:hypothetical protein
LVLTIRIGIEIVVAIHHTSSESRSFGLIRILFIIENVFYALDRGMRWEIRAQCLQIITESKVIAELPSHLSLHVSQRISDIIIFKHSGRSWVIRVLLGWDQLAIVNVDTVDFPEIIPSLLQVPIPILSVKLFP